MTRFILSVAAGLLLGAGALLAGLLPSLLRTGQVAPLDWLVPGALAIAALLLLARRSEGRLSWRVPVAAWALVALPILLLILIAAARPPWGGIAGLAAGLALAAGATGLALRGRAMVGWPCLALLLAVAIGAQWSARSELERTAPAGPVVGVMSALPLQGPALDRGDRADPLDGVGARSPLWHVLERSVVLRPLDALDAASLAGIDRLLLAQPRLLAPEELVALDDWMRTGGRAVILADPLLHWPDARPLGDPRRPPLTSLLDPLLAHWGLRLEPGQFDVGPDPVERRLLADGAMLQLAGASRFALMGSHGAQCRLAEAALMARCAIGDGQALLIADADWINDALWTLDPDHPGARAAWTGDAIPALIGWLSGNSWEVDSGLIWLIDQNRLISAIRFAFLLAVPLTFLYGRSCVGSMIKGLEMMIFPAQKRNKKGLFADSG